MRNMTATVSYRTTALSDNQVFELQRAMKNAKSFMNFAKYGVELAAGSRGEEPPVGPGTGLPTDIKFYRNIYGLYAEFKWLDLPKDMP